MSSSAIRRVTWIVAAAICGRASPIQLTDRTSRRTASSNSAILGSERGRRPAGVDGAPLGGLEPAVLQLALENRGVRVLGVGWVEVERGQEDVDRLVRGDDLEVLALSQDEQAERERTADAIPADRGGLELRVLVLLVEEPAVHASGRVEYLLDGRVGRHFGGERRERVDQVVLGRLFGEALRGHDHVDRVLRQPPDVEPVVRDLRMGQRADELLDRRDDRRGAPSARHEERGLASPDIADALALTFALPVSASWDLPPVQEYCVTEYDLYRDFDEDYWDEKDEFDE